MRVVRTWQRNATQAPTLQRTVGSKKWGVKDITIGRRARLSQLARSQRFSTTREPQQDSIANLELLSSALYL